jgi:hypothetical protein
MRHDIDIIKEEVRAAFPDVKIEQLKVKHAGADDDGLWFFSREGKKEDIQLESSTYDLPFLVESSSGRLTAKTIEEAVKFVRSHFSTT